MSKPPALHVQRTIKKNKELAAVNALRTQVANLAFELSTAKELISLLETCTACTALLHGPEVDLEEGAPHCIDCYPDEDQRAEWLTKIRDARRKLGMT